MADLRDTDLRLLSEIDLGKKPPERRALAAKRDRAEPHRGCDIRSSARTREEERLRLRLACRLPETHYILPRG